MYEVSEKKEKVTETKYRTTLGSQFQENSETFSVYTDGSNWQACD